MLQHKAYVSNVTCSHITNLVASKIKRQQFLVLLRMIAKSWADEFCSNVSYAIVPQW